MLVSLQRDGGHGAHVHQTVKHVGVVGEGDVVAAAHTAHHPVHQAAAAALHGELTAVLIADGQLVHKGLAVGMGIADAHAQRGEGQGLAAGGQGGDGHVGAGLHGDGVGLPQFVLHGDVQQVALPEGRAGGEVQHHIQAGVGAGLLVHVALGEQGIALVGAAEVQGGLEGQVDALAVAHVCVADAGGILHGVGQQAEAVLIDQEGAQFDGIAVHGHLCVQLAEVLAHQTLGGLDVTGDALHIRDRDKAALAVVHHRGGSVDVIGEGAVGGVVHLVGGGYICLDKGHNTAGHGDGQRQRGDVYKRQYVA